MSNDPQSILNASTDSVASANFIALHEKINANEERLNDINEQTKKKFQIIKENINQIRKKIEYDMFKKEKDRIDGQVTVDGLQKALANYIDMNYTKPKNQLKNDFLSGKVSLNEFTEKFKNLNLNYHYYSIVKDKLNLCKEN